MAIVFTYQVFQKRKGDIDKMNAEIPSNPNIEVVEIGKNPGEGMGEKPDPNPPDFAAKDPDPIETVMPEPDPVPDPPAIADVDSKDERPAKSLNLIPVIPSCARRRLS